ncbi:MAG: sigma-70 family RNA polymerase sigma factor [Planctomycetota bacterium]|nr:sigma-70 family RNA polymerase sigma factor [Planctomycetota bacterium]
MNSTIEQNRPDTDFHDPSNERSSKERTDEQLLLAYRENGDGVVFEQLVQRYERELYNYLRHYLGDAQMAEDVFQTTFLQVHLKCDKFEPGRKVRPWLYTVATNQAIDAQRRNRRHQMVSLDRRFGNGDQDEVAALIDLLDSGEENPIEQFESAERREMVHEVVDRLPDSLRQVVILVYYQGLKYREAAQALDIPVGTVKSRLHSAIHKLNEALTHTQLPDSA